MTSRGHRGGVIAAVLALGMLAPRVHAAALGSGGWLFDPDYVRSYVGLRYGQSLYADSRISPLLKIADNSGNDAYNAVLGLDLSRYLGLELALNYLEGDITGEGFGKLGEQTVYTIVPQVRLRYPLRDGRLVPYLVGGVGFGISEFSDGTFEAVNRPDAVIPTSRETSTAGTLGTGLEYYLAPNLSLDLEAKYIFFSATTETKRGRVPPQNVPDPPQPVPGVGEPGPRQDLNLDNIVFSAGFRMYFPQAGAADQFQGVRWPSAGEDGKRGYLALRVGGWWLQSGKEFTPGFLASDNEKQQLTSGSLGFSWNRYLGAELAVDYYEFEVNAADGGFKVNEYSVWAFLGQLRARYPLWNDRIVPYAVAGLGAGFTEPNDSTPEGHLTRMPSGQDWSLAWAAGAGVDWMVARNIALEAEAKYLSIHPDVGVEGRFQRPRTRQSGKVDSLLFSVGVRVFFP